MKEEKIVKIVELPEYTGETQIKTSSGKLFAVSTEDLREYGRPPQTAVIEEDGGLLKIY